MAVDVQRIIEQYEDRAAAAPMHGRIGEIRRAPSTDQKKERRQMSKRAEFETLSDGELLALASHRHADATEQREMLAEVERRRTAKLAERDGNLDQVIAGAKIRDNVIPGLVHDRSTPATDWLVDLPQHTGSLDEISHHMVAQATLWWGRLPDFVKPDGAECAEQARGLASRLASKHVDHYDAARTAFLDQAQRLWKNAADAGHFTKEAFWPLLLEAGEAAGAEAGAATKGSEIAKSLTDTVKANPSGGGNNSSAPSAADTADAMRQNSQDYANSVLSSLDPKAASVSHEADLDLIFNTKTAASTLPQVGEQGLPTDAFAQTGYPEANTSSERAPVLQDLEANHGLNDPSLNVNTAPGWDSSAGAAQGFPVSGSAARADAILARSASLEENTMQHTASGSCPTCSGTGKVAVREVTAYSGLPQIDQIVNADETPGETQLPTDVAFPITWDANSVPNAINQAEQSIQQRNAKSPLMAQGAAQDTSGYDASGWISGPTQPAPGGKGQRYPGYSAPTGYDGSRSEGYQDPVYGYGGDTEGNRPMAPHGAQEVNDETNEPHEQYGFVGPFNNDQGYREVSQGISTQGSQDPYIAAAQQEILRQQAIIRSRMGR